MAVAAAVLLLGVPAPRPSAVGSEYHIVISKRLNRLYLFDHGRLLAAYPVATGRRPDLTPEGTFPIVRKHVMERDERGRLTPFGTRWLGLAVPGDGRARAGRRFGIHGTDDPGSIGRPASSGCIRMHNADVERVYDRTPLGTPVVIRSGWLLRPLRLLLQPARRAAPAAGADQAGCPLPEVTVDG